MDYVRNCNGRGFHEHPTNPPLFEVIAAILCSVYCVSLLVSCVICANEPHHTWYFWLLVSCDKQSGQIVYLCIFSALLWEEYLKRLCTNCNEFLPSQQPTGHGQSLTLEWSIWLWNHWCSLYFGLRNGLQWNSWVASCYDKKVLKYPTSEPQRLAMTAPEFSGWSLHVRMYCFGKYPIIIYNLEYQLI